MKTDTPRVTRFEVREFYTYWFTSFHIGDYDTEKEARQVAADYLAKYRPTMGNGYRVEIYSFEAIAETVPESETFGECPDCGERVRWDNVREEWVHLDPDSICFYATV